VRDLLALSGCVGIFQKTVPGTLTSAGKSLNSVLAIGSQKPQRHNILSDCTSRQSEASIFLTALPNELPPCVEEQPCRQPLRLTRISVYLIGWSRTAKNGCGRM